MVQWFDVNKEGLAKLLERKGKQFAIAELISNAWDQNVTRVEVTLSPIPGGRSLYRLIVTDDDPHGFKDLSHAFTLFAESNKKGEAQKRGRFNLGEKLVLAVCDSASIASTTGTVVFDKNGRHVSRKRRDRGSEFNGLIRMTAQEFKDCQAFVKTLIPPPGILTRFNAEEIEQRTAKAEFEAPLQTEIGDEQGYLRRSIRKTKVRVYEPLAGETPSLYEMGVPVVETNDRWHVDVLQKLPLNFDRDNVPPAFLRNIRTLVMNALFEQVRGDELSRTWVKEALESPEASAEAVAHFLDEKYSEKRVIYDPSDTEANKIAISQGYQVIHGNSLPPQIWTHVKAHGLAAPAGQVTPSDRPKVDRSTIIDPAKYTPGMTRITNFAKFVAQQIKIGEIQIQIVSDINQSHEACYGGRTLTFNMFRLGKAWFDLSPMDPEVTSLLIHEFAHDKVSDHLSHEFHKACSEYGAKLAEAVFNNRVLFDHYVKDQWFKRGRGPC